MATFKPKPVKKKPGWFEVPGFSRYAANRKGEVLNKKTNNATKGGLSGRYLRISAFPDGSDEPKLCYTHDLVCRAFHGPPEEGQVVLHKDNDRLNTKPSNLKWGTQSSNIKDMWKDGLRKGNEMYQEEESSTFTHDGHEYLLNPVLRKASKVRPTVLKLKDLKWNLETAHVSEDRIASADYGVPIIVLTTVRYGFVVIDGSHRLTKASRDGKQIIEAHVLDEASIFPYRIQPSALSMVSDKTNGW